MCVYENIFTRGAVVYQCAAQSHVGEWVLSGRAQTGSSLIPLYQQIHESIARDIASGRFVTGHRLPPERELAKRYNTTVRTLRKALDELTKSGMLERIQGSGNYVRSNQLARSIYSMFRLELPNGGGLPTAKVLGIRELEKPKSLPDFGTSSRASRIRRLRFLDTTAIAVEEIWLDRDVGEIDKDSLGDSLYLHYQVKLGFWIHRAEDRVSVQALPAWAPGILGDRSITRFGFIERLSWAQDNMPIEYSRTWFDPVAARYVQRL